MIPAFGIGVRTQPPAAPSLLCAHRPGGSSPAAGSSPPSEAERLAHHRKAHRTEAFMQPKASNAGLKPGLFHGATTICP